MVALLAVPPMPSRLEDLTLLSVISTDHIAKTWDCRRAADAAAATPEPAANGGASATPMRFALRMVPVAFEDEPGVRRQLEREVKILARARHPNIVRLHFDFRTKEHVCLGFELCEGGLLFDRLVACERLGNEEAAGCFYDVCSGLAYLHGLPEKIVHRDIKPETILLDGDRRAKLADFGCCGVLAAAAAAVLTTFVGTPDYLAPEMIRKEGHNERLDMWEMGVLLYEMVVGRSPFGAESQDETLRRILRLELRFPADVDRDAQGAVEALCRLVPEERLTAAEARQHGFVLRFRRPPAAGCGGGLAETGVVGRPSVSVRKMRRSKELLESTMQEILEAKSEVEGRLLQVSLDTDMTHKAFKKESQRAKGLEAESERLKEKERCQLREMEELHGKARALQEEVARLKQQRG